MCAKRVEITAKKANELATKQLAFIALLNGVETQPYYRSDSDETPHAHLAITVNRENIPNAITFTVDKKWTKRSQLFLDGMANVGEMLETGELIADRSSIHPKSDADLYWTLRSDLPAHVLYALIAAATNRALSQSVTQAGLRDAVTGIRHVAAPGPRDSKQVTKEQLALLAQLHHLEIAHDSRGQFNYIPSNTADQPDRLVFTMSREELPTEHIMHHIGEMCEDLKQARVINPNEHLAQMGRYWDRLAQPKSGDFEVKDGAVKFHNDGKDGITITFDIMPSDIAAAQRITDAAKIALARNIKDVGLQDDIFIRGPKNASFELVA